MTVTDQQSGTTSRPAFAAFEGYAVTSILAALEMAGVLDRLVDGLPADGSGPVRVDDDQAALLRATYRYLEQRGILVNAHGVVRLSETGQEISRDRGYLVWLSGGYGQPLRHLDAFLAGGERYGREVTRDGRWVAGGAALLGAKDMVPYAMDLLASATFERVLDLGCGNARLLLRVCDRFGCAGVGVDLSPEACAAAVEAVEAAGRTDRVTIACADAADLDAIPLLDQTQLVITFFLLHEILAHGRPVLVRYLQELAHRLPAGGQLLIAEVAPPERQADTAELFTPEFTLMHAMMRQTLLAEPEWRAVLAESGWTVRASPPVSMPGGVLLLCETPR